MSCVIYWFSGTGNSRAVAEDLEKRLPDSETVWMGECETRTRQKPDAIGFVFPVYCFGIPNIVARVVDSVPIESATYVFSIATMASQPGRPHRQVETILKKRGHDLAAGWSIRMPGNYTPLRGAPDEETQKKLFQGAAERVEKIADAIAKRTTGPREDSNVLLRGIAMVASKVMGPRLSGRDAGFRVLSECSECGTCERVCPVGNITIQDGKPTWNHRCEQCFACLQWCPVDAIQFGRVTEGRKRYHHPEYHAGDFFLRELRTSEPNTPRPVDDCTAP